MPGDIPLGSILAGSPPTSGDEDTSGASELARGSWRLGVGHKRRLSLKTNLGVRARKPKLGRQRCAKRAGRGPGVATCGVLPGYAPDGKFRSAEHRSNRVACIVGSMSATKCMFDHPHIFAGNITVLG